MKNKKMTYLLGLVVLIVWGIIIYRVFDAAAARDDDAGPVASIVPKKEAYNDFTKPSKPLKTLNTSTWQQVANAITPTVTHAMMLMALALFFALKYLQANFKYNVFTG